MARLNEKLNFYIFISSENISVIAFRFFQLLLTWLILSATNNPFTLTIVITVSWVANIIFLPISGYFLDKYKKNYIIFLANILSLILIILFYLQYKILTFNLLTILTITILLEVFDSILISVPNAIIPLIIKPENISKYTGINGTLSSMQVIIGSIIGGSSIAWLGIKNSISIIIFLYLASTILCLFLLFNKNLATITSSKEESFYKGLSKGFHSLHLLKLEKVMCIKYDLQFCYHTITNCYFTSIYKGYTKYIYYIFSNYREIFWDWYFYW